MRAKEIRELVKIVEQSNIGEIEMTRWLVHKIRISKSTSSSSSTTVTKYSTGERGVEPAAAKHVVEAPVAPAPSATESSRAVEIKAPMVGTFYRASRPDAEPYVKEGDTISPGKVLCIIEAMKLMNEVEAEISGRIIKIMVNNAQPVEYNQPLFLVEPS
jgi:acetyl-CoA carboxylase biotin carboxyl carrier protein